jgi:iron(III) transport system permease protein
VARPNEAPARGLVVGGAPSLSARRSRGAGLRWLPSLGLGLLLFYLVIVPLGLMLLSSLRPSGFPLDPGFTLENYRLAYGNPRFPRLLGTTLVFGAGSTVVALCLGLALAWLVERSDLRGRELLRGLVLLPMATPPILLAIAWAMLLSPRAGAVNQALIAAFSLGTAPFNIYSLPGLIFVEGLALVPTAYLFLSPAFANMDPSLEEAALASGAGTWMLIRRVMLPLLWPSILSAAIFLAIVSLVVFDVPGTLGAPAHIFVLSTWIYYLVTDSPGGTPLYGQVSAVGMLFLAVLLLLGWGYHRLTRHAQRYRTVTGKGFRPRVFPLGRGRPAAVAFLVVYFLAAVVGPLLILLWMSLMPYQTRVSWSALHLVTLANHLDFLNNGRVLEATGHSLTIALVSATVVAALALLVTWLTVRLKVPGARTLDLLAFVPIAVPGVMIGVALVYVYLAFGAVFPIYGTIWIIAIAYITQYLPFGTRTLGGVMLQLHPELEEAALTSGAGRLRILRRITGPLVWPALAAVWIWVLAHALRELSSALMLQGRNNAVIPTLLWDYWSGGEPTRTAAGGLWLSLALVLFLLLWHGISRRAGLERVR